MTSANDTTILAVLSRYPNMPAEEADSYIAKIEHEENIPVCHAILGRIPEHSLDEDAGRTFTEFQRWSQDRTRRFRNEQWSARRRQKETRTALRMTELHERGVIDDATMLMYGISGEMPERGMYMAMSPEEKERMWRDRMEARFGPNWLQRFSNRNLPLPLFMQRRFEHVPVNWLKEGF